MPRSVQGLDAAGEWHMLKALLPDLREKTVLDLGCGFGWHCRYAREQQAKSVIGVDLSEKTLQKAQEKTNDPFITYLKKPIEDIHFSASQFDVIISSLAIHYVQSFEALYKKLYAYLTPNGSFIFSVEHPLFTSPNEQDRHYDKDGNRLHWAVDHYQTEGIRETSFLTENVIKYHRTLSTYINVLIQAGFRVSAVKEPIPSEEMLKNIPEMRDELRRPMFLIISAEKK